jgi:hypothetical protein
VAVFLYEVPVDEVLADPMNTVGYIAVEYRCLLRP